MKSKWLALGAVALVTALVWLWIDTRPRAASTASETAPNEPERSADVPDDGSASDAPRDEPPELETPASPAVSEPDPAPPPIATATGRCVDPDGRPIADVRVACVELDGRATSDADGRFAVAFELPEDATSHSATLTFTARFRGSAARSLTAKPSRTEDLGDVVLYGAGALLGRVVTDRGAPLANAEVRCTDVQREPRASKNFRGPRAFNASARTDVFGLFRIEDAPATWQRVWAGADGMLWDVSAPVKVFEDGESSEVLLVLRAIEDDDVITLAVVSPDGEPIPRAKLVIETTGIVMAEADERGRYTHYTMNVEPTPAEIFAGDPERRFRSVSAVDVQPGTRDLELRLLPPRSVELEVVDSSGAPVEQFEARCAPRDWRLRDLSPAETELDHPRGRVARSVPSATFDLVVDAPGFALYEQGPFEPMAMPAQLRVALVSLPGVRGVVTFRGEPVAGAALSLHAEVGQMESLVVAELPARSQRDAAAKATSDAHGAFTLTARELGKFRVRAVAAGFAPTDVGPLDFDPTKGRTGIAVELVRGGAIEGFVGAQPGESALGAIVVASRGDGFPLSTRAAANGAYRFDALAPGEWWVGRGARDIESDFVPTALTHYVKPRGPVGEPEANCTVLDGQTTHFDLPAPDRDEVRVLGNLRIGGRPPGPWRVALRAAEGDDERETRLDDTGSFVVAGARAGAYSLSVSSTEIGAELRVICELELVGGDNHWLRDLAFARVEGRVRAGSGVESVDWYVPLDEVCTVQGTAFVDVSGRFVIANAPLGVLELYASSHDGRESEPVTIEVRPGETARVEL